MAGWACRFLTSKTATCLAQGGRLSVQRLDQPHDVTYQRRRHRATGRDCGLWAAAFAANASLSRFGEGQVVGRNSLLRRETTEHPTLLKIVSAHEVSCFGLTDMDHTLSRISKKEINGLFSSAC